MDKTPRSLINELIASYETKHEAEEKIKKARRTYYNALEESESVIKGEDKKIKKIEDKTIEFNLETFVNELRLMVYENIDEKDANLYTTQIASKYRPLTLKEIIKAYKKRSKDGDETELQFNVSYYGIIGISMPLTIEALEAQQRDGRKLIECLHIKHEKDENGDFVNYLTCDDWRNIIFNVPLKNLLINGKLYYDGMAALKAHERDFGKEANI